MAGGRAPWSRPQRRVLDAARLRRGGVDGRRIDLSGEWLYTPRPPAADVEKDFRAGRFEAASWATTPVPSRKGTGDDRLQDRTGDFWYRRTFETPRDRDRPDAEMALLIGAIDDFDVAYLNGTRIGRTGEDTPHFWETPRLYRFPRSSIADDGPNALMLKVTNGSGEGGIAGPVLMGRAASLAEAVRDGAETRAFKHERGREGNAATLALSANGEGYAYRVEWTLPDDSARFHRRITVTNLPRPRTTFPDRDLRHARPELGPDPAVIFPGSLPVGDLPASRIDPGDSVRPEDRRSPRGPLGRDRQARPGVVVRRGGRVQPRERRSLGDRPGDPSCAAGDRSAQTGGVGHAGDRAFLARPRLAHRGIRGVQEVYREIGLARPGTRRPGLRSMVLYCGHPGGPPELNYRTYGGFRAIEDYLPTLEKLGVDLLWFLPIWEHGDGVKWNLYSPFDHFRVSPLYGYRGRLERLSAEAAGGRCG